jgi:phosphopantothenoylcysteine decarboxylase/phosphopantothenate--cysteine ligase
MLTGKKFVIGITGSIAAYKIPFLIRLLIREGSEVQVIMTPAAVDFVTPLTLSTLSCRPVIIEPFKSGTGEWNSHVDLGMWADAMIFAPVTANTMGKMVNGIADNFLVTAYLSAKCPVFIAPAMDLDMYLHPSTQRNIEALRSFGNRIIEPQTGELASGLTGPGRMEEPGEILNLLESHFSDAEKLIKKKVLITAGPTYESIDPVRFIGNFSTGKMGFALARVAAEMGADVTLITGPTHLAIAHPQVNRINVTTAREMHNLCLDHAVKADIIIMSAAVADYEPAEVFSTKVKKDNSLPVINLIKTPDILADLGKHKKNDQILVGFALETDRELENAEKKLVAKNLDYIVLNSLRDPGAGFGNDTNQVTIIAKDGTISPGTLKSKQEVARDIFNLIITYSQKHS